MKAGDYVRTKLGPNCNEITIRKIIEADENYYILDDFVDFGYGDSTNHIGKEDIIKSSPNKIDLIKVGDYVNGKRVEWIGYDLYRESEDGTLTGIGEKRILFNEFTKDSVREKGIKSILTKEQFESMKYKVGE